LIDLLVKLLLYGVNVGIVTAAGYPGDAKRYEQRLSGLLEGLKNGNVGEGERGTGKFYVLGKNRKKANFLLFFFFFFSDCETEKSKYKIILI